MPGGAAIALTIGCRSIFRVMTPMTQTDAPRSDFSADVARSAPVDSFVLKSDALAILGRSEPSWRRDRKLGLVPGFLLIGRRRVGLLRSEVNVLVAAKAAGLSDGAVRALVAGMLEHRARLADTLGVDQRA